MIKTGTSSVGSNLLSKVITVFTHRFKNSRFINILPYKNISWLYVSTPQILTESAEITRNISFLPFSKTDLRSGTSLSSKDYTLSEQLVTFALIERLITANLVSYYSTFVKLLLLNIHN
jgi:hypothetical protein